MTRPAAAALLTALFVGGAAAPPDLTQPGAECGGVATCFAVAASAPNPVKVVRAATPAYPASVAPGRAAAALPNQVSALPPHTAAPPSVRSAAADDPTGPPPLRVAAPSGARPGRAAGLRVPERCTPPPADTATTSADTGAKRMQLPAVHRLATGAGQVVAVIDTGVAPHPRLGSRLRGGGDYLAGGNGLADCDGHGTAVAGIIAASSVGRDGGGVEGMAPDATVLAIRQSSPSFQAPDATGVLRPAGDVHTLAQAIVLAVRSGAGVINISEAVCLPAVQAGVQGASIQAALRLAARSDVVVVAAAGNAGVGSCAPAGEEPADQVALPGWYGKDILAVGAVGPDDAPAGFTVPGPWVDVAAPGTGLRSLAVGGGTTGTDVDGTSFAAPWVSGLAALLRERFPKLTAAQVVDRIVATARRPAGGRSELVGRGVIDPVAALTAVPDILSPDAASRDAPVALLDRAPRPTTSTADVPIEPAAGALAAAVAAAAWLLRRRPARRP